MDDNRDNIKQLIIGCHELSFVVPVVVKKIDDNEDNIKQLFSRCQKLYQLSWLL